MKSRVLISGSEGFIAGYLKPFLKYDLVSNVDIVNGNDIFSEYFEEEVKKCNVVIHLAALTNVEDSKKNPKPYFMTNVFGTARVAYLCMKYKKKLIYPSTLHISDPWASPYAESKLMAEQIVRVAAKFTPVVILRLYNVFGKGMNNNSGSIINLFLKSDKIEVYGDGSVTRDFIHVRDVVSIMKQALRPKWNNKCVEVGTGKATSIKELAELFAKYRNKKVKYLKNKPQLKWPIANTKLLHKLYVRELTTNLEEDIKELCQN